MSGSRAQGVALVGLVGLSLGAGMALAQGPQNPFAGECNRTATPEDIELAKGTHQAARQFYERGEYERASQYWGDVFKLDCNAVGTLLNIANAYEKLYDPQNAVFALEAYLIRTPNAPNAAQIQTRIKNLKERIKTTPTAPTSSGTPAASSSAGPAPSSSVSDPPPPLVKPYGVAPWVTVGIGGAGVVAGAILFPLGYTTITDALITSDPAFSDVNAKGCRPFNTTTKSTQMGETGTWLCSDQGIADKVNSARTQVLVGKIALGVGGAAVVGGLVWEFMFNKPVKADATATEKAAGSVHFAPILAPGVSGAMVTGSF